MGDLLLGRLVEVWTRQRDGLRCDRPSARWLSWDPASGRLFAVRRGQRWRGAVDADAEERAAGFHWADRSEVATWATYRPTLDRQAAPRGELAGLVYLATKGSEQAEWEHWFSLPRPRAAQDNAGEWYFRGRVRVTDRGIVS